MAMKDLIILGAGVHAAEMAEIVQRVNNVTPTWNLLGHVARDQDNINAGHLLHGQPVLGKAAILDEYSDCHVVFEYAFPDPGNVPVERWASLVDPSCFISATSTIGRGSVLYPGCFVGLNASLGGRTFMLSGATINHDTVIESHVTVCSGVTLAGNVVVESDCYLGQTCSIRQSVRVGRNSMIGMGSVVLEDVQPNSVMAGNPAKRLRERKE